MASFITDYIIYLLSCNRNKRTKGCRFLSKQRSSSICDRTVAKCLKISFNALSGFLQWVAVSVKELISPPPPPQTTSKAPAKATLAPLSSSPLCSAPAEVHCVGAHLVGRSLEDAGTLVDSLCPQADVFVLQLLCSTVQRLGHQASLWDFTLHTDTQRTRP